MIKEVTQKDLAQAIDLVNRVFAEFVAVDYGELGLKTFNDYLEHKYEEINVDLLSGNKKMWGYFDGGEIVGVISIKNISHISLMFVDKNHHRKGIAKALFAEAKQYIQRDKTVAKITVNSSPYAVAVYEKLGFTATDTQKESDGIIYVPMTYDLASDK